MHDPVAVHLERGPEGVWLFVAFSSLCMRRKDRSRAEDVSFDLFRAFADGEAAHWGIEPEGSTGIANLCGPT